MFVLRSPLPAAVAPVTPLLDLIATAPTGAWSTRKIRDAYAGNCIRVRRSSDDAEADIGFSGNNLDTAALLAHTGANDGFIVTWYDQSGNTRNLTQSTAASQPKIVSSGSVITTINSKPSLLFDGSDDFLDGTTLATFLDATDYTMFSGSRPTAGGGGDSEGWGQPGIIGDSGGYQWHAWGLTKFIGGHWGSESREVKIDLSYPNVYIALSRYDDVIVSAYLNGTGSTLSTTNDPSWSTQTLRIGRQGGYMAGTAVEVVLWDTNLSNADANLIGAEMASYAGVSWTSI